MPAPATATWAAISRSKASMSETEFAIGPRTMASATRTFSPFRQAISKGVGTPAKIRCHHRDAAVVDTALAAAGGALQRQAMLAENARATRLRLTGSSPRPRRSRFSSAVRRR